VYETAYHTKPLSDKSFLVTGGCGFIGSNIVEYLIKHGAAKVRVLDNLSTGFEKNLQQVTSNLKPQTTNQVEFIEGDITNLDTCHLACESMDYVLHQAALGSVPRSIKNPLATHAANVTGFLNMLIASRDAKVKRFVYASSSSVYGDHQALPKVEEHTGKLLSPYAVSKMADELYASVFADTYGLEIIGLRYFNVFGPNQSPEGAYAAVIPLFMQSVLSNTAPFIDGDGEQTRDFTFVENAVQANIKALFAEDKKALNRVYNVAVGENASVNKLYQLIAGLRKSDLKPFYRDGRAGDIRNSLADISKAKSLLGYQPTIRLEEGLRITMDWFHNAMKNEK
jgi:UDP-N-acetylglucosamine/UDP-N-acetylgalactosamine 4-epimerase